MKTFARLIWRYVLTAVGVVLLLLVLTISLLGWISWREGYLQPQREYSYSEIADSMVETDNGMIFGAEHAPEEWMDGYAWAMILDEKGNVKWNYDLPDELDNHYSSSDIASFSRWYLDDYPVFCWSEDYGLFVAGLTKGSLWKYNLYNSPNVLQDIVHGIPLVILGMLLLVLIFCLWIGWRGTKRLRIVAEGLDAFPFCGNWTKTFRQGFWFLTHSRTKVTFFEDREQACTYFLIGHAYDPFTMQYKEEDILAHVAVQSAKGEIRRALDEMTGVYVTGFIRDGAIYFETDASGMPPPAGTSATPST